MAVVRALCIAVRPRGVVAVEDLFTPALAAGPHVPALRELAEVYSGTVCSHGGDPPSGPDSSRTSPRRDSWMSPNARWPTG